MERYPDEPDEKRDYDKHAKTLVRVHIDRVWFDDGFRNARKGETIKLSDDDYFILSERGQVAKLGSEPKALPTVDAAAPQAPQGVPPVSI